MMPINRIKNWLLGILIVVVLMGGIRLKRQADLIQANYRWNEDVQNAQRELSVIDSEKREELEKTTMYANVIAILVNELRGGKANDQDITDFTPEEYRYWDYGRQDGYNSGKNQDNPEDKIKLRTPEDPNTRFVYITAFLSNYLKACIEQQQECPQINSWLETWFRLSDPDKAFPSSDSDKPVG
ncbi:MAG TPA: hypothetical protein VJI96_01700 [Candidatus Andersenbacteria bacterium]|nr:hypothetical protein [Candidatus Andersenbacteria bacterium]